MLSPPAIQTARDYIIVTSVYITESVSPQQKGSGHAVARDIKAPVLDWP
jgi:hypothetical protein